MKDAYTFDRDAEGLEVGYEKHIVAYDRIFDRIGLEWYRVESDVGMMGGTGAHEYMAPCAAGENDVALAPGYAANVEVASADAQPVELPAALPAPEEVETPGLTTIAAVAGHLGVPAGALLKAFPVDRRGPRPRARRCVRGDHRVNEIKLRNALGADFRPAQAEEFARPIGPPGFIGPVGADVPILLDEARRRGGGATSPAPTARTLHLRGVEPGRDFAFERVDVRTRRGGRHRQRPPDPRSSRRSRSATSSSSARATRSRSARRTSTRPASRAARSGWAPTGSARARIAGRRRSSSSPTSRASRGRASIAPFDVRARRARQGGHARSASSPSGSTTSCARPGSTCSTTTATPAPARSSPTRSCSACPLRLTVGRRTLAAGEVEVQVRRGREQRSVPLEGAAEAAATCGAASRRRPRTRRRARSATFRPAARAWTARARRRRRRWRAQPLHPWTIPNAIGYVRLALIPVFLVARAVERRRHGRAAVVLFAVIGWTRLPGRDRGARHRPVLAPRAAARPARRPAAGPLRRRRLLALRAAAALGARAARRARAVRCSCSCAPACAAAST